MQKLSPVEQESINCIRFLSIEAIQKAKSGHPGLPMGFAPAAYRLFTKHMSYNSKNSSWINRDRFILSAGHGSMLLYSLLHLAGYDLSLEDLKQFRQWGSKTPGHPEYGHTDGVELTTGPLGQGIANAVGMAIAGKHLASKFNKPGFELFNSKLFVIAGDGCLQEGVSAEASSLAGHLGLNNLVVIYDDNNVTIDGDTSLSFTEDVKGRYEAYGWNVIEIKGDGNDIAALDQALEQFGKSDKPTLVKMQSIIGFGSPNKQGTSGVHGSPLGDVEIQATKDALGWEHEGSFVIPQAVKDHFAEVQAKGVKANQAWDELFAKYQAAEPALAKELKIAIEGGLPVNWEANLPEFKAGEKLATRQASGSVIEAVMPNLWNVMGGSADLTPSNNTYFSGAGDFQKASPEGRYIRFGVREHAMGSILNGINVYGALRAYGATFLTFADYMLPAIRVASLAKYPSIFVFTHDSIGLGEDGPTHQPVEHVNYLRNMPNLVSFRPADANETKEVWKYALQNQNGPVAMALTRQGLPTLDQEKYGSAAGVHQGGYTLSDQVGAELILVATGSEVSLALEAQEALANDGIATRVVSMPSVELFEQQSEEYQKSVFPRGLSKRIVIEAGIRGSWGRYIGHGAFVGMEGFGASAPAGTLYKEFGITTEAIVAKAKELAKA